MKAKSNSLAVLRLAAKCVRREARKREQREKQRIISNHRGHSKVAEV
jgi:hypothetical protein